MQALSFLWRYSLIFRTEKKKESVRTRRIDTREEFSRLPRQVVKSHSPMVISLDRKGRAAMFCGFGWNCDLLLTNRIFLLCYVEVNGSFVQKLYRRSSHLTANNIPFSEVHRETSFPEVCRGNTRFQVYRGNRGQTFPKFIRLDRWQNLQAI